MATTIRDVAQYAGVSIATVSRVFNKSERVQPQTAQLVKEAIKALNFRPSRAARTMVSKKNYSIGLIVPNVSDEYWGEVSEAIQDELWERGYNMVLYSTQSSLERERAYLNKLNEQTVDGVIYSNADVVWSETSEAS